MSVLHDLAANRINVTEAATLMSVCRRQVFRLANGRAGGQTLDRLRFSPWRDGVALVRMLAMLGDETGDYSELHMGEALHEAVKDKLFLVLDSWVPIDDLENIFGEIEGLERFLPKGAVEAVEKTMLSQFDADLGLLAQLDDTPTRIVLACEIQAVTESLF